MPSQNVELIYKILFALAAGIFGVAIAISVQHIKLIGVPRFLVGIAIIIQLLLSWGVFIFVMLLFKSGFLPDSMPNDDYSALTLAYFLSAIPHIVVATAIIIYNKEINKWLESRYGKENVPNMENALEKIDDEGELDLAKAADSSARVKTQEALAQQASLSAQSSEADGFAHCDSGLPRSHSSLAMTERETSRPPQGFRSEADFTSAPASENSVSRPPQGFRSEADFTSAPASENSVSRPPESAHICTHCQQEIKA